MMSIDEAAQMLSRRLMSPMTVSIIRGIVEGYAPELKNYSDDEALEIAYKAIQICLKK